MAAEQTTDPRVAAVIARMRTWNCFEPLRAGALEELAAEVVAVVAQAGRPASGDSSSAILAMGVNCATR